MGFEVVKFVFDIILINLELRQKYRELVKRHAYYVYWVEGVAELIFNLRPNLKIVAPKCNMEIEYRAF